jgi:hypothetical protein
MPEAPSGGARATAVSVPTGGTIALVIPGSGNAGPVNLDLPPVVVAMNSLIRGVFNLTGGSSTTGVTMKCYRGPVVGTQIGTTQTISVNGAVSVNVPFCFQDLANPIPQDGYSIGLTAVGATATCNEIVGSIDDGS